MAADRQSSFATGEIAPSLHGRSDIPGYAAALKTCRNFIITPYGKANNRPGTEYVVEVKDSLAEVRLVPFDSSDDDNPNGLSWVLEFGPGYIRFVRDGGQVIVEGAAAYSGATTYEEGEYVTSGGLTYRSIQDTNLNHTPASSPTWWWQTDVYEVTTPYADGELAYLKYAQSGNVLFLAHKAHALQTLTLISETEWVLEEVDYSPVNTEEDGPPSWSFFGYFSNLPPAIEKPLPVETADIAGKEWLYLVTALVQRTDTGEVFETYPYQIQFSTDPGAAYVQVPLVDNLFAPASDQPVKILAHGTAGLLAEPPEDYQVLSFRYYKGRGGRDLRGGVFGFIGEATPANDPGDTVSGAVGTLFVDDGIEPDYSLPPPNGRNPFEIFAGDGSLDRTEEPSVVGLFERRLVLGRTDERADWGWLSRTLRLKDFDFHFPPVPDDSLEFRLSSDRRDEIRWTKGIDRLFWGTSGGIFSMDPGLKATELIQAVKHTDEGSTWLDALVAADSLLYVRNRGGGICQIAFEQDRSKHLVTDLSLLARHLVDDKTIKDWTWTGFPQRVAWIVREDGTLLGLTFARELGVTAWHWHQTSGFFEQVCAIPEGQDDAVYCVVNRTIDGNTKRYIERFAQRRIVPESPETIAGEFDPESGEVSDLLGTTSDIRGMVFLDSALTTDGRNTTSFDMDVSGGLLIDDVVTVYSGDGLFSAGDVGDLIIIDPDGEAVPVTLTAYTDAQHMTGRLEQTVVDAGILSETTSWGWARDTFSGLDHLEGLTVSALVDGAPVSDMVVSGGEVTLPGDLHGLIVVIGLPYTSELESLDSANERTREKNVKSLVVEVESSRGLWLGESLAETLEWRQRSVTDGYGPVSVSTSKEEIHIRSTWNTYGRFALQQRDPLPVSVLAVTRHIEGGGKP